MKSKNYSQAIEYIEKSVNLNPQHLACLCDVYEEAGINNIEIIDTTIKSLKNLIEQNPDDVGAYNCLGGVFSDYLHNYTEAVHYLNKSLEITQSKDIEANLIEALLGAKGYDELNTRANMLLEGSKDDVRNLNVRFIVLCSKIFQGSEIDKKKLISDFIEYYEALPNNLENTWNYKGIIHMIKKANLNRNDSDSLVSLIDLFGNTILIEEFKKNFLN